ncbi:MAG: hypothetical protein NTV06_08920 [candidate division Zixibacteria bacterium]|nr:hypothetical protein [candidate division Zixibacteria bacterium]
MPGIKLDKIPQRMGYSFTGSASLYKDNDYIALKVAPVWRNAQKSPPENFDWSPKAVLINQKDFEEIWEVMKTINWGVLSQPAEKDLSWSPPDVNYTEGLNLSIDGERIIGWAYPFRCLNQSLRLPLDSLVRVMGKKFEQRCNEPAIPFAFSLILIGNDKGDLLRITVSKRGDSIEIGSSDRANRVRLEKDEFQSLLKELQEAKIFYKMYPQMMPRGPLPPENMAMALKITVESIPITDVVFDKTQEEDSYLKDLWFRLKTMIK